MKFHRNHLSFYSQGVFIDELSYGEMFITSKMLMFKPMFFYGIERTEDKLLKIKFKYHGESSMHTVIVRKQNKVYRRAY
ncbi:MAG: hypothetical protein P8J32_02415 [bacterium]|nr:hypothetical protein [bacterium]